MKRPLSIALLSDGIPPFVMGGMQKHSRLVAEYMARLGHRILLYHFVYNPVSQEEVMEQFSSEARSNITVKTFDYQDIGKLPGHYLRAQRAMSKRYLEALMKESKVDFIYTKGFMGWELLKQRSSLGIKASVGVKFHGMNMFQKQPDWKGHLTKHLLRGPVRWIMNESDVVFSYGGRITDIIQKEIRQRDKVWEVPAGIEERWLRSEPGTSDGPVRFLFVGRYDRVKGLPEMYQALKKMEATPGWEMHFVGPIPEEHQLQGTPYIYHGSISSADEIKAVYDRCDVIVSTSISEGMPNVLLEGMSRGLTPMATDVGATSILVNDQAGLLIPDAPNGIYESFMQVLKWSEAERLERKQNSLQLIRDRFTWEKIALRLEDYLYREVKPE